MHSCLALQGFNTLGMPKSAVYNECGLGQAPGYWSGPEWHLHEPRPPRCAGVTLQRFLSHPSPCPASWKRKGPCFAKNMPLIRQLGNASILMVGDSTTTKLFDSVCELFQTNKPKTFIPIPNGTVRGRYQHKLRSADHHHCHLTKGLTLGAFAHYGVTGPPYWSFAYPLAPWLAQTTLGQIRQDLPRFRTETPAQSDPTLIVFTSGYWDISAWWRHEANFSRQFQAGPKHAAVYVERVREALQALRTEFPGSHIVWRTLHPGFKHSITGGVTHMLNGAVKAHAHSMGPLEILDVGDMVETLTHDARLAPPARVEKALLSTFSIPTAAYGTYDGRHLWEWIDYEVFNVILNVVWQVLGKPVPGASRSTP